MNLMTGFAYKFRVRAINKEGPGPVSAASASIYTALEPSEVENLKLISRSDAHITIKWDPPRSSGGLPLTGFKIY